MGNKVLCKVFGCKWKNCVCVRCGLTNHDWDYCICKHCGKKRNENHSWVNCMCKICGKIREEGHEILGCSCSICGKNFHEYDVKAGICKKCGETNPPVGTHFLTRTQYGISTQGKIVEKFCEECKKDTPSLEMRFWRAGASASATKEYYCLYCNTWLYCIRCKRFTDFYFRNENIASVSEHFRGKRWYCQKCSSILYQINSD